jgi:hypothetical protein
MDDDTRQQEPFALGDQPDFAHFDEMRAAALSHTTDDDLESLRADVARLERKVDTLLGALDIKTETDR